MKSCLHAYSRFTHLSEELKECPLYNEPRVSLEIAAADISSLCSLGVVLFSFSVVRGTEGLTELPLRPLNSAASVAEVTDVQTILRVF